MQTQTSNALHNAIMEAGGKDRPPMLASGNYVQWKSRIKRYIDTKPNHELIHYCLQNRPYKYKWNDKVVLVAEDDEMSKDKKIDKIMALISLSFKKIYKPTNNNLQTSSNTNRENQDNSPRINRGTRYDNQRIEQADKRDGTDDEPDDQELEAHYMYMAQIQEVTPDAADNSGPIFDFQP
nr:hypothetical protein [Tanacetum cinerariifolium]